MSDTDESLLACAQALEAAGLTPLSQRLITLDTIVAKHAAEALNRGCDQVLEIRAKQDDIIQMAFGSVLPAIAGLRELLESASQRLRAQRKNVTVNALAKLAGTHRGKVKRFLDNDKVFAQKIDVGGYE